MSGSHARALGCLLSTRRRSEEASGLTSLRQNPNPVTFARRFARRRRVNARVSSVLNVLETCFHAAPAWTAKRGRSAERQTAASTAATQRSAAAAHRLKQRPPAPAGESRSAWKSAQEPARRLRKRRAATDDGRAHHFRTASTHGRCCHR